MQHFHLLHWTQVPRGLKIKKQMGEKASKLEIAWVHLYIYVSVERRKITENESGEDSSAFSYGTVILTIYTK